MILEQEKNKWTEIPNYDEIAEEISKLIQGFEEEERQQKEQGKPSLVSCASPLMSFLIEESAEELSAISIELRLGCPEVANIVDGKDLSSKAMKGNNSETSNLQIDKPQTDKSQSPELKLESESEIKVAHSSEHLGQVSTLDQHLSSNGTRKTEGAPLPLLKLRVSPTQKIVNRLSQTFTNMQNPEDLTADLLLSSSLSVTASLSFQPLRCLCSSPPRITHFINRYHLPYYVGTHPG